MTSSLAGQITWDLYHGFYKPNESVFTLVEGTVEGG